MCYNKVMQTQQILMQKDTVLDVAIDYADGYILHVNSSGGVVEIYKVREKENDKEKELIQITLLK